jgi:hypothetical protein
MPIRPDDLVGLPVERVIALAKKYGQILAASGASPIRMQDYEHRARALNDPIVLNHCAWVCSRLPEVMNYIGGHHIALRWLGIIQGVLIAYGILSLAEVRADAGPKNVIND